MSVMGKKEIADNLIDLTEKLLTPFDEGFVDPLIQKFIIGKCMLLIALAKREIK
jgi:hypothetical protein